MHNRRMVVKFRLRCDLNASAIVDNPELVIGLVGPIGVDMDAIVAHLQSALADVD